MKKIVSLILMIAMLMGVSAFAEGFTLFGKVPFGASKVEVKALLEEYPHRDGTDPGRVSSAYENCKIPVDGRREVTIAGIENSKALFAFDKNGCVYQCLYTLGTDEPGVVNYLEKDTADSLYFSTRKMLIEKYGEPDADYLEDQSSYFLSSYADELDVPFTNCVEMVNLTTTNMFTELKCDKVSEWIIPINDGDYVLIDNFIIADVSDPSRVSCQVHILYTHIPADIHEQTVVSDDWL